MTMTRKKKVLTWEDYPRKSDRLAILGFAATTRDLVPWDDKDLEVISVNEGYNFPWTKRWDRWFQIHPRWDFMRGTNNNDPNHFLWLKNIEGQCQMCRGSGKAFPIALGKRAKEAVVCPACAGSGHYVPPANRNVGLPIYMQKHWDDIPGSVEYPLSDVMKAIIPKTNRQKDYFTSSFSLILGLAFLMGYKRVELYGFEMGADTEYHYQRANGEYIMGLVQAKGMEIYIPKESTLLTGPLYAYKNMKQGYRQNMEMRRNFLVSQMNEEKLKFNAMNAELKLLKELKESGTTFDTLDARIANKESDTKDQLALITGLNYAQSEANNLTKMYDNYFWANTEGGDDETVTIDPPEVTQHVGLRYTLPEKTDGTEKK